MRIVICITKKKIIKFLKILLPFIIPSGLFICLLQPGPLSLMDYRIEKGVIQAEIKDLKKNVWLFVLWNNGNYSEYVERYANISYQLIVMKSYKFRNPSLIHYLFFNYYRMEIPYQNASVNIVESKGLRISVAENWLYMEAQEYSLFKPSYSFLTVEYRVRHYKPNVTVEINKLIFSDTLQVIITFRNNERFDIEHYWYTLNLSLFNLPLFSGYNIYKFDVFAKGEVVVPCKIGVFRPFPIRSIKIPFGFRLEAKSVKTIIIVIRNGEPGSIVIWGPMGPPVYPGIACAPIVNSTGAYYYWEFFSTYQREFSWFMFELWPPPFNITSVKVVGNRGVILHLVPNNNTQPNTTYLIELQASGEIGRRIAFGAVKWNADEVTARRKKILVFNIDLIGCTHIEVIRILKI